ncbi:putative N(4)-(beta-N-acetylglucosaminyl)-L-asparaginase GH22932 isoform X2 [Dysidea avara]
MQKLHSGGTYLDAVVAAGTECEVEQCDHSVGYGGSPDEKGETTLDAMIMDGVSHDVGAVGCLKNVNNAIGVARAVMDHTSHTLLVGDDATNFALSMGFNASNLTTPYSEKLWSAWKSSNCQPNYWKNVTPDHTKSCGPYKPTSDKTKSWQGDTDKKIGPGNHDTIGVVVIDDKGNVAAGTTTNGLTYKIAGRVGDSPIMGAGSYADAEVGGAACTGDGDIMMRFLPSYQAVESMRLGKPPKEAADDAIKRIEKYYPGFSGAIIVANIKGEYAAATTVPDSPFPYCVYNPVLGKPTQFHIKSN